MEPLLRAEAQGSVQLAAGLHPGPASQGFSSATRGLSSGSESCHKGRVRLLLLVNLGRSILCETLFLGSGTVFCILCGSGFWAFLSPYLFKGMSASAVGS